MKKNKKSKQIHKAKPTRMDIVKERLRWVYNEAEYGTHQDEIINNPFVRRAKNKLDLWNVWSVLIYLFLFCFIIAISSLTLQNLNIKGILYCILLSGETEARCPYCQTAFSKDTEYIYKNKKN